MFNTLRKHLGELIPSVYPSAMWMHQMEIVNKYTPDIRQLENRYSHWVFVCGEEQRGHKNSTLIPSAYGNTVTGPVCGFTKPEFSLWKKNLGQESFAIPLHEEVREGLPYNALQKPLSIRGELHLIRPEQFLILDKYKENGLVYQRISVDISVPYVRSVRNAYATSEMTYKCVSVPAWMYVGVPDHWKEHLDAGFQFTRVRTTNRHLDSGYGVHDFIHYPYYHFKQDEYKT